MKRNISTILFMLLVCIGIHAQQVVRRQGNRRPQRTAITNDGSEKSIAAEFLNRKGARVSAQGLQVLSMTPEVAVCEDSRGGAFAIIVRDEYADDVDNRVLAFSTDSKFQGMESQWKRGLLACYGEQLRWLHEHRVGLHADEMGSFSNSQTSEIAPLLKTKWGQGYPYNAYCPTSPGSKDHVLTGCVSTAMTQLMAYYKGQEHGQGRFTVGLQGKQYDIDFSKEHFAWRNVATRYTGANQCDEISRLMNINMIALSSDFVNSKTAANLRNLRTVLVNFWGYSAESRCCRCYNAHDALQLINADLEARRPVLLSGGGHCFICDGRQGDYLHLNLGWNGDADGYYRLSIVGKSAEHLMKNTFVREVLCNVHPGQHESVMRQKQVHVAKAGTLLLQLTDADLLTLRSLKVTGQLNSADMRILRRMAGATDEYYKPGQLAMLDLSDARFITDETASFCTVSPAMSRYTWTNRTYDFSKTIDKKEFRDFLSSPMAKGDGFRFVESTGLDKLNYGPYSIAFHTVKDAIAPLQFFDCQNLRKLILPKTTKKIYGKAFQWCNSLTEITLPASVKQIESGAFAQCYLLQQVNVETLPTETAHKFAPTTVEGQYGQTRNGHHLGLFFGNSIYTCRGLVMQGQPVKSVEYKNMM